MKILYALISLFCFSSLTASEWLYYKHFPWVYDNKTEDWLYLKAGSDGQIYAYSNNSRTWGDFETSEATWDEKYEEWIKNPSPYGGLEVLQKIRDIRNGTITNYGYLDLSNQNITDVTPIISGITELVEDGKISTLILSNNNISDLSPFENFPDWGSGLTFLELEFNKINSNTDITPILHSAYYIYLQGNDLSDEQKKECEDTRGQLVFLETRLW